MLEELLSRNSHMSVETKVHLLDYKGKFSVEQKNPSSSTLKAFARCVLLNTPKPLEDAIIVTICRHQVVINHTTAEVAHSVIG